MKMKPQKVRRNGFSNYIAVTGFAKVGEIYKIESIDEKSFKCTRLMEFHQSEPENKEQVV